MIFDHVPLQISSIPADGTNYCKEVLELGSPESTGISWMSWKMSLMPLSLLPEHQLNTRRQHKHSGSVIKSLLMKWLTSCNRYARLQRAEHLPAPQAVLHGLVLDSQKSDPDIDSSEVNARVREVSGQTSPNPGVGWEGKPESADLLPFQRDQPYKFMHIEER